MFSTIPRWYPVEGYPAVSYLYERPLLFCANHWCNRSPDAGKKAVLGGERCLSYLAEGRGRVDAFEIHLCPLAQRSRDKNQEQEKGGVFFWFGVCLCGTLAFFMLTNEKTCSRIKIPSLGFGMVPMLPLGQPNNARLSTWGKMQGCSLHLQQWHSPCVKDQKKGTIATEKQNLAFVQLCVWPCRGYNIQLSVSYNLYADEPTVKWGITLRKEEQKFRSSQFSGRSL